MGTEQIKVRRRQPTRPNHILYSHTSSIWDSWWPSPRLQWLWLALLPQLFYLQPQGLSLGQFHLNPDAYTGIGSTVPASPSFWNFPCNLDFTFTFLRAWLQWSSGTLTQNSTAPLLLHLTCLENQECVDAVANSTTSLRCSYLQSITLGSKLQRPLWVDEYEKIFSVDSLIWLGNILSSGLSFQIYEHLPKLEPSVGGAFFPVVSEQISRLLFKGLILLAAFVPFLCATVTRPSQQVNTLCCMCCLLPLQNLILGSEQ